MLLTCNRNKFWWLSDSGFPQGYSRSCVKRETQGSSVSGNARLPCTKFRARFKH